MYATIKKILDEKGLTFYNLSKMTGIRESVFSNLKNRGGALSFENAVKVADALKISLVDLKGG